jgi:EAL domain-containing protein (putative c-di-GMP-specific phosphodiesterase class I)
MHDHAIRHLALDNELHRALENREFFLCWQPIIDLRSGAFAGAEALLRWRTASGDVRLPHEFIGVAESNGLIVPIGEWVIRSACAQAQLWQTLGFTKICAMVNVSARQLNQQKFLRTVEDALATTGLDPHCLEIEITETAVMAEPEVSERMLRSLQNLGVRIALDDFGTGYSSLNYLKRLPIDGLKIDRSFVHDIAYDQIDKAIAQALITLCHGVGLQTTAEGIESSRQLAILRELGCDRVQGHYFSEPVDAAALLDLLRSWNDQRIQAVRS